MNKIQRILGIAAFGVATIIAPAKRVIANDTPKLVQKLAPETDKFVKQGSNNIKLPSGKIFNKNHIIYVSADYKLKEESTGFIDAFFGPKIYKLHCTVEALNSNNSFNGATAYSLEKPDCDALRKALLDGK